MCNFVYLCDKVLCSKCNFQRVLFSTLLNFYFLILSKHCFISLRNGVVFNQFKLMVSSSVDGTNKERRCGGYPAYPARDILHVHRERFTLLLGAIKTISQSAAFMLCLTKKEINIISIGHFIGLEPFIFLIPF